jgi:hypothetical protein
MSTVFIFSGWLKNTETISLLAGEYPIVSKNLTVKEFLGKYRACIINMTIVEFEKLTKIHIKHFEKSTIEKPFDFLNNGIKPLNINALSQKKMRLQLIETDDFTNAVKYNIISQKDELGNYLVSPYAYKLKCSDSTRVATGGGNFVYRRCFLRPDTPNFFDIIEINDYNNTLKNQCFYIQKINSEIGFFSMYSIGNYFDETFHESRWLNESDLEFMQLVKFPRKNHFKISEIIYWELINIVNLNLIYFPNPTILLNIEAFGFKSENNSVTLDLMITQIRFATRSDKIEKFELNSVNLDTEKKGKDVLFIDLINKNTDYSKGIYQHLKNQGFENVFFLFLATNVQ